MHNMSPSRTHLPNSVLSPKTSNSVQPQSLESDSLLIFFKNRISGTHPSMTSSPENDSRTNPKPNPKPNSRTNHVSCSILNSSNQNSPNPKNNNRTLTNKPNYRALASIVKVDLEKLHSDPVSQVTQAAQVLNHSIVWNYQKLPNGYTQCFLKFIDREKSEDPDYDPIFGQGVHGDKKHAKMKAAELVLEKITGKWGDWKEIQEKNKKSKKKKYQSEYRLRQDQVNKERIENKETKGIYSSREERRNNGCDRTSRDRDSNRDRSPSKRKTSVETDSRSSRSGSSSRYGSEYSRKSSYDRGHDRYRDKNRR